MVQDRTLQVPYIEHESDMARNERKERRLIGVIALLIGALICQRFILTRSTSE